MSNEKPSWHRPDTFEGWVKELDCDESGHRYWAIQHLVDSGDRAVPPLIAHLTGPRQEDWGQTARALGTMDAEEAVVPLTRLVGLTGSLMGQPQEAAAQALRKIGQADVPLLLQALGSTDGLVRQRAASLAGDLEVMATENALISIAPDTALAIDALAKLRSASAVPMLIDILGSDRHPGMRVRAAAALGALGDTQARGPLATGVEDADAAVAASCLSALARLAPDIAGDAVISGLRHPDPKVRVAALRSAALPHGSVTGELVARSLDDPERAVREAAWDALEAFEDAASIALLQRLRAERRAGMISRFEGILMDAAVGDVSSGFACSDSIELAIGWEGLSSPTEASGDEEDLPGLLEEARQWLGRRPDHIMTVGNLTSRLSGSWWCWSVPLDHLVAFVFEGDEADQLDVLGAWVSDRGDEGFRSCFLEVCRRWAQALFWGADDLRVADEQLPRALLQEGVRVAIEADSEFRTYLLDRLELGSKTSSADAAGRFLEELIVSA